MTDAELDAIEARVKAATDGPWQERSGHVGVMHRYGTRFREMVHFVSLACVSLPRCKGELRPVHEVIKQGCANAEFIAHARTDVPALIAEVRRLRAELDAAVGGRKP